MLAAQKKACLICKLVRKLLVDHCHITKRVRGLLCKQCNTGIGMFRDKVDLLNAAILYLNEQET